MLELVFASKFKKDLKKLKSSRWDEEELLAIIDLLAHKKSLEVKHQDHALAGNYKDCRECHIRPDWLLIYQLSETRIVLVRTGSHAQILDM